MKKILFLLFIFLNFLNPARIFAYTGSEVIQRVDSDITILNNLFSSVENENDPEIISATLIRDIPTVKQHLSESSTFYESAIATETDEELKTTIRNINNDIQGLQSNLTSAEDAINVGDEDLYSNALTSYDNNISSLNSHVQDLNSNLGVADYSWLVWPFIIAMIISVALFIMSRGNPILPAEQLRNQFEFALFKSSLWPFAGSAISYFWFLLTPPGGTFYILWWPIGIGYIQFARGLYSYIRYARPAINIAKREQQDKLEKLLMSDKFQHESLQQKAEEISKLDPVIRLGRKKSGK